METFYGTTSSATVTVVLNSNSLQLLKTLKLLVMKEMMGGNYLL